MRTRYYNPGIGRFQTMDGFPGILSDPNSLNKYVYGGNDPVNKIDPSGEFGISVVVMAVEISMIGILMSIVRPNYAFGGTTKKCCVESFRPTFRTLSIFRNLFLPIAIISEPQ